jgi:3-hydroxymyristoyl/3-hydroxydecanoyl-(acyl carrier protein) dehydratase
MNPVDVICRIPADHPALPGHFPGHPIVPGVVLLELVQRQARVLAGFRDGPTTWRRVKFLQPVSPEQPIHLHIEGTADAFSFAIKTEAGEDVAKGQCRHGALA